MLKSDVTLSMCLQTYMTISERFAFLILWIFTCLQGGWWLSNQSDQINIPVPLIHLMWSSHRNSINKLPACQREIINVIRRNVKEGHEINHMCTLWGVPEHYWSICPSEAQDFLPFDKTMRLYSIFEYWRLYSIFKKFRSSAILRNIRLSSIYKIIPFVKVWGRLPLQKDLGLLPYSAYQLL